MDLSVMSVRINMSKGYTLIELLVSMGILAILFTLVTLNISPLPSNTLQVTNLDTLLADIKSQQSLAMSTNSSYGVRFETSSYTLFKGASYSQGLFANTVISLDSGIVFFNVRFPSSAIIFSPGTGDVTGYTAGSDSFTIKSTVTNKSTVIRINKNGATY
jgi:prepilin-type N-terminal cleavage/methylation domain-containing protein